jgi:catechol 2,3-dioxygenase-like lactoylglutathione lyase family enzyme
MVDRPNTASPSSHRPSLTLWGVVLGAPDPRALCGFYERLLGWERRSDEPDWATCQPADGSRPGLSFQLEEQHVPPVWPGGPGEQQMQIHLDILVDDLDAAGEYARSLGAVAADFQPQEDVRVFLDPVGHPFCLFTS